MVPAIPRDRLAQRVHLALEQGDLMLAAGAGFGKTTLLEQALGDVSTPVAWVRCTEIEREPGFLLMRIVRELAAAAPGTTDALAERLAVAAGQVDAPTVTSELIAELSRLLVEPVVLVLDDAERLDGADSLFVVGGLMRADISRLRMVVAASTRWSAARQARRGGTSHGSARGGPLLRCRGVRRAPARPHGARSPRRARVRGHGIDRGMAARGGPRGRARRAGRTPRRT